MAEKKESSKLLIGFIILVVMLWATSGAIIFFFIDSGFRGIAGDMFGAINGLFSGLAFAGIIYTIHIQRKELALQRVELALQREATNNSTKELAGQREVMNLQRFESTLFNMLELHNQITSSITYNGNQEIRGRSFFFKNKVRISSRFNGDKMSLKACYEEDIIGYHSELMVYMSSLLNILKYIDQSDQLKSSASDESLTYISILFSLISPAEKTIVHVMLQFNKSIEHSELFDKYEFFKNADIING